MRKKNLKIQVAALAVTGAIATTPFVARAEETSSAAVTGTEATATTTATEAGTTTAGTTTEAAATPVASTTTAAPASTATTAASTAATTAATTATTPAVSTTEAASPATSTTEASGIEAAASAAPVTVEEPAVDPNTTVPNNVNTVIPEEKNNFQGTKIDLGSYVNKEIKAEDAKGEKGDSNFDPGLIGRFATGLGRVKNKDLVITGDLSIKESTDPDTEYDSTSSNPHDVESEKTYTLKADLDVSAVHNAITASSGWAAKNDTYVTNLTTGLRATFTLGDDIDGTFFKPTTLAEKQANYQLSSADGNPMIFRINYANSDFKEKKVTLAMDLDLTQVKPFSNTYTGGKVGKETLYVVDPVTGSKKNVENFNHPDSDYGVYHNTSVFGNLKEMVTSSAKKIQLVMKGVKLTSATSNSTETETATEKRTTTEGTINGTLVGYVNATVGSPDGLRADVSYQWGAIQNDAGRDSVAGQNNDKVALTVKFTKTEPLNPVVPTNPVQPVNPVNPTTPGNGGNGGNGGSRTPIVNPSTPSQPGNVLGEDRPTPSNQGEVLGENRPAPTAVETVEKKGEVLGESRPSGKNVSGRAAVATGDNNFTALWASLFGLSAASLAGFVVLRKKEQEA